MRRCLIVIILICATFASTSITHAAGIVVDTNADDNIANGNCTLREAIIAANTDQAVDGCIAGLDDDLITFAANYTITLGSQLPAITTRLVITGNGAGNTILQANANPGTANYRVLEVASSGNLTLNDMTVRNGRCNGVCATDAINGGGIYNAGVLVVDGCAISSNVALAGGGAGGGIYTIGTLTIRNNSVVGGPGTGNQAANGGGLRTTNRATIEASTVSYNSSSGISNSGTLDVNGSLISSNTGYGIGNTGALIVDASTVSTNTSFGINSTGTMTIRHGSIIGGAGAGNLAGGIANGGTAIVDASTISANNGPGISNDRTLTVQNGSLIGGVGAGNSGRGITNQDHGSVTVDASTISANNGGGISTTDNNGYTGPVIIQNGSIIGGAGAGNHAVNGGGISNVTQYATNVTIDASTVSGNTASSAGGGIYNSYGTLTIRNGSIIGGEGAGNQASFGGGLYNGDSGNPTNGIVNVTASSFIGNIATSTGGAVHTRGTTSIYSSRFRGNTAAVGGGAIYAANGSAYITESCFVDNSSTALSGPAGGAAPANWWGVVSGPGGVGPGSGTTIDMGWSFLGWLTASSLNCNGGPFTLSATGVSLTGIDLNWVDAATDETGFQVERSLNGVSGWAMVGTAGADATSYSDGALACIAPYYYRVRAYKSSGGYVSLYSNVASAVSTICPPLAAPSLLTATLDGQTDVDLGWSDSVVNETEFRIERSPDGTSIWTEIATPPADATSYTDPGVTCAADYYYRVRAYRSGDGQFSDYSDAASVTVPPCPLLSLSGTSHSFGNQFIDTPSDGFTFTIQNPGTADLNIDAFSRSGSADYSLSDNTCDTAVIEPLGSCSFNVILTPSSTGPKSASFTIPSDAPNSPHVISLSGTGTQPGVTIVQTNGTTQVLEHPQWQDWDEYTMVLTAQPRGDVTISFDTGMQIRPIAPVVFTQANWATPQRITVYAVNDSIVEGPHTWVISHHATGGGYDPIPIADVTVDIADDDTPGVTVFEIYGTVEEMMTGIRVAVTEGGKTDSYSIRLNSQPTTDVTISFDTGTQLQPIAPLTITPADWSVEHMVNVAAVDDAILTYQRFVPIVHSISSADPNYDGFSIADVMVTINDNETYRIPPVLKGPKNGVSVNKPPKLAWKAAKKPLTGYHVEILDSLGNVVQSGNPVKNSFPTTPLPFGIYTWHVAVRDASGQSVYSAPFSFEVTALKGPKNGSRAKNNKPSFSWVKVTGASSYHLQIATDQGFNNIVLDMPNLPKPTYKFLKTDSPLPSGLLYWRIQAVGAPQSNWTLPWSITVP